MEYDFIIVGAGPSGLFLADYLSKSGKVLLVDQFDSIGGCHRVVRVNGQFSEHAPRVYSTAYINTINWFQTLGIKWDDYFTPYNFSLASIGGKSIFKFSIMELLTLFYIYFKTILNPCWAKHTSVSAISSSFSSSSKDYLDRLCKLTDGSGSDRYSVYEFCQLVNQQLLYKLYQPKYPNDVGLFSTIYNNLSKRVDIRLSTTVNGLLYDNNKVIGISTNNGFFYSKNTILAIPPSAIQKISPNSFKNLDYVVNNNSYIGYVSVVYKWNNKLKLPKIHGFPTNDWGVVFIVLSDYFEPKGSKTSETRQSEGRRNDDEPKGEETLISTTIYNLDTPSKYTNKTANQSSKDELVQEILRQLPFKLPPPDNITFSPTNVFSRSKWNNIDVSYVSTSNGKCLPQVSNVYYNLYNCGPQNGKSYYSFASFESAVQNSISLLKHFNINIPKVEIMSLNQTLFIIFLIIIVIYYKK